MKLKLSLQSVRHIITAIAVLTSTIAHADAPLAGKWVGTVTEQNSGTYVVAVEISANGSSGTVEYRRYPCGGNLSLISGDGSQNLYAESLTFGQEKCLGGLNARLTLSGTNSAYFEEIVSGSAVVYGTLTRVGGGVGATCGVAGIGLVRDVGTCFEASSNQSACIGHAMRKYENSIAGHQDGCFLTCGKIVYDCIGNTRPANNPDGTLGCIVGMQSVTCSQN